MSTITRSYKYNSPEPAAIIISKRDEFIIIIEALVPRFDKGLPHLLVTDEVTMIKSHAKLLCENIEKKSVKSEKEKALLVEYYRSGKKEGGLISYTVTKKIMLPIKFVDEVVNIPEFDIWVCKYRDRRSVDVLIDRVRLDVSPTNPKGISVSATIIDKRNRLNKKYINIMGVTLEVAPIISKRDDGLYIEVTSVVFTDGKREVSTEEVFYTIEEIITGVDHIYDSEEEALSFYSKEDKMKIDKLSLEKDIMDRKLKLESQKGSLDDRLHEEKISRSKQDQKNTSIKAVLTFFALASTIIGLLKNAQANEKANTKKHPQG